MTESHGAVVPGPPAPVATRPMAEADWDDVRRIYAEGIATGIATFETEVASRDVLEDRWVVGLRWVAEVDGVVAGWTTAARASTRPCYAGVAETSVYVDGWFRGRGVGRALIRRQNAESEAAGFWTLQTSIFAVNEASLALHTSTGYRVVGTRERIARRDGRWWDTVMLERRRSEDPGAP